MATPKNVTELYNNIVDAAKSFGFKNRDNGILRDCIHHEDSLKNPKDDDNNFWFGFVREDQRESGAYQGLSFVIFPENVGHHCLVAIGIGSSNLGADSELASSPQFRRSFYSLTKNVNRGCLFFKYKFDEIEQPTPCLQDYVEKSENDFNGPMVATTKEYNIIRGGLLPAAMVVDYTKEEEYNLIIAWLAQYAEWRNWSSYKNGKTITGVYSRIQEAINKCRTDASCPTPEDVKKILFERQFIVLQGAPGCGKTWTAKMIAKMPEFKEVKFVQFHAETTYADFVYGIKPVLNGTSVAYEGNKGALLEILDSAVKAEQRKEKVKFLLIIDEFNRANLANVLGPVFYLFEQNNGGSNNLILNLGKWFNPVSNKIEDLIYDHIPSNLYVIATMNTADRSLAMVDFALRRRFSWVTLRPHKLDPNKYQCFDTELFDNVNTLFLKFATDEELNLQPGQSYFMDKGKRMDSIIYGLMPLMKEYFNGGFLLPAKEEFIQLFYKETGILMYE
jgi:hypothetical protein